MYKVFFNDRIVYLGDNFPMDSGKYEGLSYRFNSRQELQEIIDLFSSLKHTQNLYIVNKDLHVLKENFKACFTLINAGGGLVFNKKGEFLIIKRNGVWDLPKGKLEEGEDFETAALRETGEETGLKKLVTVQPLISTYHIYHQSNQKILKKTQWFELHYPGKTEPVLQSEEGITDHRWVKPGKTGFIGKNTYKSILDVLNIRTLI